MPDQADLPIRTSQEERNAMPSMLEGAQTSAAPAAAKVNGHGGERRQSLRTQVRQAAKELETSIILKALERHRWNRRRAAETLQISYRSLLYKMKYCNLRTDAPSEGKE